MKPKTQLLPFQSLVVGLDYSEPSRLVLKQALKLSNQFQVPVSVVHVLPFYADGFGAAFSTPPRLTMSDVEKANASIRKFYQLPKTEMIHVEIRQGEVAKTLIKVARSLPEPLILIGSAGRGSVSNFILGSEAERIALSSPFPVWVHRGNKIHSFNRLLVPTDLSKNSHRLIQTLKRWAQALSIESSYLFVRPEVMPLLDYNAFQEMSNEVRKEAQKAIQIFRKKVGPIPISMIAGMDPSSQIVRQAKKYDLIAMSPHSKSGLLKKFGRTTAKVLRKSDRPVLIFKS